MTAIHEQYASEMRQEFGYLAAWLPGTAIALGDIGVLRGTRFESLTSLSALGVDFASQPMRAVGDLEYASAGQVDVEWHGRGGLLGGAGAEGGVTVSFKRSNAIFFQASGCVTGTMADLPTVEQALIGMDKERWRRDWAVVTEVVVARSAAVIISSRSGGRLDLRLQGGGGGASLAELASRLRIASEAGIAARVLTASGLTPLFRVCQLRGGVVRRMTLVYRGEGQVAGARSGSGVGSLDEEKSPQ
ncbi:hypothetical protein ACIP79_21310 [Streptomyces sp. NPDC088747]|uniref:hypothetical protein n=1 Tax=Streptomyces sp. NPDC088747 TaxID=3365886 RepID=UPI0038190ECF